MKCTKCGKEIILIPSAKERADKYGGAPAYYTSLFTIHADCLLQLREERCLEHIKRIKQ